MVVRELPPDSRKETKSFFFTASIMRKNVAVLRQGTLNAVDEKEALDKVYEMGRTVWKRSVVEVTIINPFSGEVKATSKVGEAVQKHLLPHMKEPPLEEDEDWPQVGTENGFVPWSKPINTFIAADMGTYFSVKRFALLTGFK